MISRGASASFEFVANVAASDHKNGSDWRFNMLNRSPWAIYRSRWSKNGPNLRQNQMTQTVPLAGPKIIYDTRESSGSSIQKPSSQAGQSKTAVW
jgi:hypothetical protein